MEFLCWLQLDTDQYASNREVWDDTAKIDIYTIYVIKNALIKFPHPQFLIGGLENNKTVSQQKKKVQIARYCGITRQLDGRSMDQDSKPPTIIYYSLCTAIPDHWNQAK